MSRICAAICTFERYDMLPLAIESLKYQDIPIDTYEILVVDNSPDAERSQLERLKYEKIENLRWIYADQPGLSRARNIATAETRSPLVAFLDDDAIASASWCRSYIQSFEDFGLEFGVIGGRVIPRFLGKRPDWLSDDLLLHLSMLDLGPARREISPGEWVVGANVAYRVAALKAVGGFSTSLGRIGAATLLSSEETELAARLRKSGLRVAYEPSASVEHIVDTSRTSQRWFRRRFAWQAVSALLAGETGREDEIQAGFHAVLKFFAALPPSDRTVMALLRDTGDAGEFNWQLGTIYNFLICVLGGVNILTNDDSDTDTDVV